MGSSSTQSESAPAPNLPLPGSNLSLFASATGRCDASAPDRFYAQPPHQGALEPVRAAAAERWSFIGKRAIDTTPVCVHHGQLTNAPPVRGQRRHCTPALSCSSSRRGFGRPRRWRTFRPAPILARGGWPTKSHEILNPPEDKVVTLRRREASAGVMSASDPAVAHQRAGGAAEGIALFLWTGTARPLRTSVLMRPLANKTNLIEVMSCGKF
jgi:hypothetical protein